MDDILTKDQVAELLKVKPRTVSYLTATRQIPFVKGLGRDYRYLRNSIIEWVKAKEIKPLNDYTEL